MEYFSIWPWDDPHISVKWKRKSFHLFLITANQVQAVNFWICLWISLMQHSPRALSALLHFFLLHHQQILIGHLLLEEVVFGPKEAVGWAIENAQSNRNIDIVTHTHTHTHTHNQQQYLMHRWEQPMDKYKRNIEGYQSQTCTFRVRNLVTKVG